MRDLEARPVRNSADGAFQNAEAGHAGRFLAAFKQKLQPQANAEERLVLLNETPDGFLQLQGMQGGHGIPKSSDTGQYGRGRAVQDLRVRRNRRLHAQIVKRFLDALQIACAVIDNRYHPSTLPFR